MCRHGSDLYTIPHLQHGSCPANSAKQLWVAQCEAAVGYIRAAVRSSCRVHSVRQLSSKQCEAAVGYICATYDLFEHVLMQYIVCTWHGTALQYCVLGI
jgi:hypothetical protein